MVRSFWLLKWVITSLHQKWERLTSPKISFSASGHQLMLFVAWQRDVFHIDTEGVTLEVYWDVCFRLFLAALSSCCASWQELGNMSSLSLDKWFSHNEIFFLNAAILSDCSNILCPLPCTDTFNVLMCSKISARYATLASHISLSNSSELVSERNMAISVLSS